MYESYQQEPTFFGESVETRDEVALEELREDELRSLRPHLEVSSLPPNEWDSDNFDKQVTALRRYIVLLREPFMGLGTVLTHQADYQNSIARSAKAFVVRQKQRKELPYEVFGRTSPTSKDLIASPFLQFENKSLEEEYRTLWCVDGDVNVGIHYKRYLTMKWDIHQMEASSPGEFFSTWYESIADAVNGFFTNPDRRQLRIKIGSAFDQLMPSTDHIVLYSYAPNDPELERFEKLVCANLEKRGFALAERPARAIEAFDLHMPSSSTPEGETLGNLVHVSSHSSIVAALILLELQKRGLSLAGRSSARITSTLDEMIGVYNSYDPDQAWTALQPYR